MTIAAMQMAEKKVSAHRYRNLPLSGAPDAGLDASCQEVGAKAGAVVAAVAKQLARLRENRQEHCSAFVVVGLACG